MAMQAQVNYINYLSSFAGTEMDEDAAAALQRSADIQLVATFDMINALYPNQRAIYPDFGYDDGNEGGDPPGGGDGGDPPGGGDGGDDPLDPNHRNKNNP